MEQEESDSADDSRGASSMLSRRLLSTNSRAHIPMSIEELSLVQDLSTWTNTRINCIGYLSSTDHGITLQSCSDVAGKFEIAVDFSLMKKEPPLNTVIQLYGEISVSENAVPFIRGSIYRNFESVDLVRYNRALDIISNLFPLHINRNTSKPGRENQCKEESDFPDH